MPHNPLRALFDKMDRDKSGTIDAHEYRRSLRGYATNESVRAKIMSMDLDLDGRITFEEFAQYMSAGIEEDEAELHREDGSPDWFALFVHFDHDGSGIISLKELKSLLEEIGRETDREGLIAVIRDIDRDANMEISYSEFIQYFRGPAPKQSLSAYV